MVNKKFLRRFFKIPRKQRLTWAVIVEHKDGNKECRLGLLLEGTNKVVDVIKRKFVQTEVLWPFERKTYPANKNVSAKYIQVEACDENVCAAVSVDRKELEVEYFSATYSPEIMEVFLF